MTPRRQRVLIAVITVVGLLRGVWWVITTPVWSPIDEQAHYDFAASIGRLEYPTVGETRVHRDVLDVVKRSSTSPWQSTPLPPDPTRAEWGALAQSYEAAQPPLYYGLLAPVWRATSGLSTLTSIYVLRVVSLLVSLALIPLAWLLGRELFAHRPEVGVGAAAVTALLSGVNGNFAIVANDGLMTVLCAATLLATARVVQRGFTTKRALVVGVLMGAAMLTKLTALPIAGVVAAGAIVAARRHRRSVREVARFGAISGGVAALIVAPWVAFNLIAYGGVTASGELDAITGSLQSDPPMNLRGLVTRLRQAGHGFWDQQLVDATVSRYAWVWFLFAAGIGLAAFARRREDRALLMWLFAAWPLAFAVMVFVILGVSDGRSDIAGRHLYVALPALVLGIVAATVLVAGRWAMAVLATVAAVGLTFEARDAPAVIRGVYSEGAFANVAPVVDESYADQVVVGRRFEFAAPCPAVALRLVFRDAAPTVGINGQSTEPFTPEPLEAGSVAALYAVAGATQHIIVDVPADARVAAAALRPAHRIYCVTEDNYDERFAQNFRRGHPPLTAAQVGFPPQLWAGLGWLGATAAVIRNIGRWGSRGDGQNKSRSSSSALP